MQFNSFQDLLFYCQKCTVCKGNCPIYIDIVDVPTSCVNHKFSEINNQILRVCGDIVEILGVSKEKSSFEIMIPFEYDGTEINTKQFPDESFEFFIDARCEVCKNRHVSTSDIWVDKHGMSGFSIEEETVCTDDFCIEINYSSGDIEISQLHSGNNLLKFDIDDLDIDFTDLEKVNTKLQKYFILS